MLPNAQMDQLVIILKNGCYDQINVKRKIGKIIKEVFALDFKSRADDLPEYRDIFQSPRANPKHAYRQINGETQMSQHDFILQRQKCKNGKW